MKLIRSEGYNSIFDKKFLCFKNDDNSDWQGFARFFIHENLPRRFTAYFVNDDPVALVIADDKTIIKYHI